jgi:hypothetical protein
MRDYLKEICCGVQLLGNVVEVAFTKGGKRNKMTVLSYKLLVFTPAEEPWQQTYTDEESHSVR